MNILNGNIFPALICCLFGWIYSAYPQDLNDDKALYLINNFYVENEYIEVLDSIIRTAHSFDSRYSPAPLDSANEFILRSDILALINDPISLRKIVKNFLHNYNQFATSEFADCQMQTVDTHKLTLQATKQDGVVENHEIPHENSQGLRSKEARRIRKIIDRMSITLQKAMAIRNDKASFLKVTKWSNKIIAKAYDGKHKTNLRAVAQSVSYELPRSMRSMGPASRKTQTEITVLKIAGGLARLSVASLKLTGLPLTLGASIPLCSIINHGITISIDAAANHARGRSKAETATQAGMHLAVTPVILIEPLAIAEAVGQNAWNIPIIAGYASIYIAKIGSKISDRRFIEPVLAQYSGNPKILFFNLERMKYAQELDKKMTHTGSMNMSEERKKKHEQYHQLLIKAHMKLLRRTIKYYYRWKINLMLERYTEKQSNELRNILDMVEPEMEELIKRI